MPIQDLLCPKDIGRSVQVTYAFALGQLFQIGKIEAPIGVKMEPRCQPLRYEGIYIPLKIGPFKFLEYLRPVIETGPPLQDDENQGD